MYKTPQTDKDMSIQSLYLQTRLKDTLTRYMAVKLLYGQARSISQQ